MKNLILVFIVSLSITLGGYLGIRLNGRYEKFMTTILGFAAGVMFHVSAFDMLKEAYEVNSYALIYALIGFGGIYFIMHMLPHNHHKMANVSIVSMILLSIHNIPEGMGLYLVSRSSFNTGLLMGLAIIIHNIPMGMVMATMYHDETKDMQRSLVLCLISSLLEFSGVLFSYAFMNADFSIIFALTSGAMVYVALFDLLKEALEDREYLKVMICFVAGIVFIALLGHL